VTTSSDGTVRLWDLATAAQLAVFSGYQGPVERVVVSRDGTRVFAAGVDRTVRQLDGSTLQQVGGLVATMKDWALGLDVSPDGRLVAVGSYDGTTQLFDAATHQPLGRPMTLVRQPEASQFSPDGKILAVGGVEGDLRLFDVATQSPIGGPLRGAKNNISDIRFSPDGARLLTWSWDGTMRVWDPRTGEPIGLPLDEGRFDNNTGGGISPDGRLVASGGTVPLVMDLLPTAWEAEICQVVGRNLSRAEWARYLPSAAPYRQTCPEWPAAVAQ
jgi:WD40 repeat protein